MKLRYHLIQRLQEIDVFSAQTIETTCNSSPPVIHHAEFTVFKELLRHIDYLITKIGEGLRG